MSVNPCLQPACLSDVPHGRFLGIPDNRLVSQYQMIEAVPVVNTALQELYDAEWKKRGFERSP